VVFHLKAQLAEAGDQTKDASQPWPDDRKVVDLGVLTLTKVAPNSSEAEKLMLFMPRASLPVSSSPTIRCRAFALLPMASRSGGAASKRLCARQARGAGASEGRETSCVRPPSIDLERR